MRYSPLPAEWLPPVDMERIIVHWTGGAHQANSTDKKHYHVLIEGDGKRVRGNPAISHNSAPIKAGYAAHTLNLNTGSIGIALCAMWGAKERPFDPGKYPITREQWQSLIQALADICPAYEISPDPETLLTHAEVQETLGVRQRGKWDITRLPFDPTTVGAKEVGDRMRSEVDILLTNAQAPVAGGEAQTLVGEIRQKLDALENLL